MATPYRSPKGVHGQVRDPRFSFLQLTKQSLQLRQWIIGWWITNPNMGKLDWQGSTALLALRPGGRV